MPQFTLPSGSIFHKYRIVPLVLAGLVFLALLVGVCLLLWSLIAYYSHSETIETSAVPIIIYLGAVFLSSGVMTLLIKGGTVFPAAALSLIAAIATLFIAEPGSVGFGPALLKVLLTLVAGVLGFTLAKLWVQRDSSRRSSKAAAKQRPILPDPPATTLTPAPEAEDFGMKEQG